MPEPADARGSRRNYSQEWEREEREEERREEREEARDKWQDHNRETQERHIQHRERQLDTVIDHHDRTGHHGWTQPVPGAPAPRKKKSGTCIYGDGNKVLYQPAGVVCDH